MSGPSDSIEIRPIVPADAARAAALSGELGYPCDDAAMRARIEHLEGAADHGVFVATRGGRVVGWVHVSAVLHLQGEPRAEIGGLVVTADARSLGIGAMLVARAEQWARDQRLASVVVRSQIMREDAHRFYLREGYERTKTSAVFTKNLA
jgi:(aminoalkyl)phosphonate N-acetyltransferase